MISAVVLTKNEEKNIGECLKSLSWCDAVIVIDDNSSDKTVEISEKKKAKVFSHALDGDFSAQRNFGLEKAKNEWVLHVDADERVTPSLREEIIQSTNNPINQCNGFYIKRKDFMWGKLLNYGETGSICLVRLGRKGKGKWVGKVHETWKIEGEVGVLVHPLIHYPHPTIEEFLQKINYYTDLRAKELYEKGIKVSWWSIILYLKAKFFLNYILRRGLLDGTAGLVVALMMSFHSFLVRGKLWLLWKKS